MAKISINVGDMVISVKLAEAIFAGACKALVILDKAMTLVEAIIIHPTNGYRPSGKEIAIDVSIYCNEPYVSGLAPEKWNTSFSFICPGDLIAEAKRMELDFPTQLATIVKIALETRTSHLKQQVNALDTLLESVALTE